MIVSAHAFVTASGNFREERSSIQCAKVSANFLSFADPDVERPVQYIENEIATTLMAHDCSVHVRRPLETLQRLSLQRSGSCGAPAASR